MIWTIKASPAYKRRRETHQLLFFWLVSHSDQVETVFFSFSFFFIVAMSRSALTSACTISRSRSVYSHEMFTSNDNLPNHSRLGLRILLIVGDIWRIMTSWKAIMSWRKYDAVNVKALRAKSLIRTSDPFINPVRLSYLLTSANLRSRQAKEKYRCYSSLRCYTCSKSTHIRRPNIVWDIRLPSI